MPSVRIDALGTSIDLVGSPEAVDEVARDWSRCAVADPAGEPSKRLDIGERSTAWLTSRVTREAIEGLAGQRILLHAAGLSIDDGRVLVLVGPSGRGKTTACLELCRSAYGYATDETVAIDEDLQIAAYPKPLLLRRSQATPKDVVGPDELGLASHPDQLTAHRIVLLRRDGTSPARLEQVSLTAGLLALIPETSAMARMPRPLSTVAHVVTACGGVHALHYTEIAEAAGLLDGLMSQDTPAGEPWERLGGPIDADGEAPLPASGPDAHGTSLAAAPVHEAIRVGDDVLALRNGRPVWLQGIGSTIWTCVLDGVPEAELPFLVEEAHGPHPDARRLVASAIDELLEQDVLVRR